MRKSIITITSIILSSVLLSGCSKVQIFEDSDAKYQLTSSDDADLELNTYYVKDGTKFYPVYKADKNGGSSDADSKRCAWVWDKYNQKIPTYYKDELIAYASSDADVSDVSLERYSDTGYSLGIYGLSYTDDGFLSFDLNQHSLKKSDAASKFKNKKSNDIKIETINGEKVTADMINNAGVLLGLSKEKKYTITFFAGTYYGSIDVVADTHFFQSFEIYSMKDHEITKNGYVSFKMPEDAKDGYYYIADKGLFRYISQARGVDLATINYNEAYFTTEEDQMAAYSQQYDFTIAAETKNAAIIATFDGTSVPETADSSDVKMMVTSPDGQRTTFDSDLVGQVIEGDYETLSPGKWTINIVPQSLSITDVEVVDNTPVQEKTQNTYTFDIDTESTGVEFYVIYEGEGDVTAQVIGPDGQSHDLTSEKVVNGNIGYTYDYLPVGKYTVNVYHDPDTKITEVDHGINEENKSEEIISVED